MTGRRRILTIVACVLVLVGTIWSYGYLAAGRRAAELAQEELKACRTMAAEIKRIRWRPAVASEEERASSEITGTIERTAKDAGIAPKDLVRISPGPPQPVERTAYREKPTLVQLTNVTLEQMVKMLHAVSVSQQGLRPKSLRITAPQRDDTGKAWNVEITLTYLIYEPVHAERPRSVP